jgi:outer membrane protein assembly factor BamB
MIGVRTSVFLVSALGVFCTELQADWPVFRGSPEMKGIAEAKLPDRLTERWTFKTGNAIEGAPAVVADTVYVASADKHLYAIELKSGQEKWKAKLKAPTKASPAVRGGRVIIGDADGMLYCFGTADGKPIWTFEADGEITGGANFHGENILVGSQAGTLFCLSPDGKKIWDYTIDGPVNGSPAVASDKVFVAGCDSILHIVDAGSGKNHGTIDLGGQAGATAAVSGDQVFVGTMTNQVVAIDWKGLKKIWAFEAPRRQQPFYSSAAVTTTVVVAGSRDKKIYAIDRATGKELWSFIAEREVDASPVIVGERVYVGSLSDLGDFYALNLNTGEQLQKFELDGAVTGSAAVGPDCILVGTETGRLYCFGAAN